MKTQEYLSQKVSYAGFALSRSLVLEDLRSRTDDERAIGLYMMGLKPVTQVQECHLLSEEDFLEWGRFIN